MAVMIRFLVAALACLLLTTTNGFTVVTSPKSHRLAVTTTSTELNMFKGLSDAFKNDERLGKPDNPGLKGGPKYNEQVTINGKTVKAIVGQKVKQVAASARVKIPYNCQQGDCGTCTIKMNGRKVKACQMTIPNGRCTMETLS